MSRTADAPLSHRPVRPPRRRHVAEHVYAALWQAAMVPRGDDGPSPLARVLRPMTDEPTQRHATVAASVVCWLGTGRGLAWRREADRYASALGIPRDLAYLAAWAVCNRRDNGGGGVRAVEGMLAPEDHFGTHLGHVQLVRWPELDAEDHEVADCVVRWLGGGDGQAFLRECEDEVRACQDTEAWAAGGRAARPAR